MAIPIINVSILNGSNGFRVDGEPGFEFGHSGVSVSGAGDINGDGFDDVMVGAYYAYPDAFSEGRNYIIFGKAGGFSAVTNLTDLDGDNGFRLTDRSFSSPFLVSDAGDINGDGFDDVMIGAQGFYDYHAYPPRDYPATAYVVFGRNSGFAADINLSDLNGSDGFQLDVGESLNVAVSSAGDVNGDGFDDVIVGAGRAGYVVFGKASSFDATFDLSNLDGSNGFRLNGVMARDESLSSAGDMNGDGFDDVIVSAGGMGYVVFGQASGFDATFDVSGLNGSNGFKLNSLGGISKSVSSAGDINGDGFDDVIIGDYRADLNGTESGSSYVVFGRASGFNAALDLTTLDGHNGFRMDGVAEYDFSGYSVSRAGDVNEDGFDDVIIGAPRARSFNGDQVGVSYVVFGRASAFDAVLDLSSLDGTNGFRLEGRGGEFGSSVSSAGDLNNDGVNDLIIGAPRVDGWNGASYVLFVGSFLNEAVYRGTSGNDSLVGTILAERFEAGDGNDFINGLGGADIFHGDAGDDTISIADFDFERVDGGMGSDTLKLAGSGLDLNLADFHDRLDGLEVIDMTRNGSNTLTLSLSDLVSLSNTTHTFTIDGDEGDRVVGLMEEWKSAGTEGIYRLFTNGEIVLRVKRNIDTDGPKDTGKGTIIFTDLDGSNGFRLDGAGGPVSNAGDINSDGFDDVIVGAPGADPNGQRSGSSYVIFGKATGFEATMNLSSLDGSNGFRLDGVGELDLSGSSVSNAGDVNGDGFEDVLIGAPLADSNGSRSGSSYVVFGKGAGFAATLDLSSLDGKNGFRLDGVTKFDYLGQSVSNAGDINGDGFGDLLISAPNTDPDGNLYSDLGSSYVVFGRASDFSAVMDLSKLDGSNGFRLDGTGELDLSGSPVSNAGDVNGDGYDDVIIGALGKDSNGINSALSFVVFGHASGFDATLDLSTLDGSNGFRLRLDGVATYDRLEESVSSAGDVNGDGFDDVIIGAPLADSNGSRSGSSYVVFGKGAGFAATLDLSSLDGKNGFRLDGVTKFDYLGQSVSNAGDINGDGFGDLLIGAPKSDPDGNLYNNLGSSYVVFGRASDFSAVIDLSKTIVDGESIVELDGAAGNQSGNSVSGAGDVNGDGFDDLLVGDPGANSSYIIFGSRDFGGGQFPTISGTLNDDVLRGTSAAERFEAGDGNDLMIGRGGADVFRGGAGVDQIKVPDLNFASIDGGSGNDILHLDGKDLNLDLTALGGKIHGIETICIYGRGDNTLALTADSVLNLSDTSNTLKLHGNAGDRVTVMDDGWVDGGVKGFYHTYTNDDAVLLVGANLAIDFV